MSAPGPGPGTTVMPSVRSLLAEIVDYAGLFPPAKLEMQPTVRNYAEYLAGDDAWMLGRIIIPAARLDEFEKHAKPFLPTDDSSEPWRLSALTVAAGDPALARDLERIHAFNEMHGDPVNGLAVIDAIELKAETVDAIDQALDGLIDEMYPFFEISAKGDPRGLIASLAGSDAGAKIRTGGVTADAYPSVAEVAGFIAACAAAAVPFKATAGLHHPIRHRNTANGAIEHGFLNLFLAGCAGFIGEDSKTIEAILGAESASAFDCRDEAVGFGKFSASTEQIVEARALLAVSFGSCSFDEPREDLRGLGLLR